MAESQEETVRKRQRMSKVWDHFILKKEDRKVQCLYCNVDLAYHNSTTVMMQHLIRKHPVSVSSTSIVSDTSTSQRPTDGAVRPTPSCTAEEADLLTESILKMLVTDMQPLSMVEEKGFKKMISAFSPNYSMPSRLHFTSLMEMKYQQITEKLKTVLQDLQSVALTIDIWTSDGTEGCLRVACHFLGEDWETKSFSLTAMPLKESHTAVNIADWLEETTDKFHIPFPKVKAVIHNNGASALAAAVILKERHGWASVRCPRNTLDLVVQSALINSKTIANCVASARAMVEHFKKSELACAKLKEKQQQMGMPPLMLIRDVSNRWNSTYRMLSRLLGQRWPVTAALTDPAVSSSAEHHNPDLKPDHWNLTEELTRVLGPFDRVTEFLRGEQYITLSALPQLVHNLKKATLSSTVETSSVKAFQTQVAKQITERWQELFLFQPEAPNAVILAAALDPRFRKLKFLTAEDVFKVQSTIQSMALAVKKEEWQSNKSRNEATAAALEVRSAPKKDGLFVNSILGSSSDSNTSDEENEDWQLSQAVQKEVFLYFGEHPLSKKENPLTWWKTNAARYPTLATLAKSFLGIPATLTASERMFSVTGNIVSKRRASLSFEHLDMLTFLHCNHVLL
ncbi:pyridoxal phosphate homeostasis protein isoform X1 [Syngnathoides biaculeatus]|uniref:pyridoxal phosphate homeostasis protein isoform X1 n=1 Tax=Syngnathoides biaculeatus TaxID=300417 RepID=UPI002ADDD9AA|nr:pyridoxal phosphate homeostasis protein isoform X1 [Syngnathoides biaculeatus]